ncbi:rhomboid family intramembrane serine protease [Williamsia sp. CHRR-6]|uniref:rhomboid family intramembrane serine protease n=1 Tax=Williamsia sp. CHRR-6 TaxID=2835871 RepID=UPI001BD9D4E9|nr:rhomboid family intramembrane serine protease [Williamsia sp. CHRR-6]MBT0567726.1 rhomboid family intramembrane serine protease [Williamsia sp. CHRR-6]
MVCYRHPDRPTGLQCTRCGRSACPECLRPAAVGQHCLDCVGAAAARTPRVQQLGARRPLATYVIIAINLVVFAITAIQARTGGNLNPNDSRVFYDGVLFGPLVHDGEYWRLFTSGFLHFSVIHVGLNMFTLYILGRDLERALGTARYVGVYVASLLGGSAAVLLFSPNSATAGASGAIYGVLGGLLIVVLRAKIPPGGIIGTIVINLVITVTIPGISLWAHLGGLAFGAAATAGIVVLPSLLLSSDKRRAPSVNTIGWIAVGLLIVLALGLAVLS